MTKAIIVSGARWSGKSYLCTRVAEFCDWSHFSIDPGFGPKTTEKELYDYFVQELKKVESQTFIVDGGVFAYDWVNVVFVKVCRDVFVDVEFKRYFIKLSEEDRKENFAKAGKGQSEEYLETHKLKIFNNFIPPIYDESQFTFLTQKELLSELISNSREWYQTFDYPIKIKGLVNSPAKFQKWGIDSFKGKTVLDIGCNEGYYVFNARRLGAEMAIGLDHTVKYIETANKLKKLFLQEDVGVLFVLNSLLGYTNRPAVDWVFCMSVLHHIPFEDGIEELAKLTKEKLFLEMLIEPGEESKFVEHPENKNIEVPIPTLKMAVSILQKYFKSIEVLGESGGRYYIACTKERREIKQ